MKTALCVAAFVALLAGAQRPAANIIDVAVVDGTLAPVRGLNTNDFEVRIDDSRVEVSRVDRLPPDLSIVVVFDGTNSQPLKKYEANDAVLTHWLPVLTSGDRIRLGMIAAPLTMSGWLAAPQWTATARGFFSSAPGEPSPLWDATAAAVGALAGAPGTKLILLLTDGRANANVIGLEDAAARALSAGVAISIVGESAEHLLAQTGDPAAKIRPDASLRWLADETGGMYLPDGVGRRSIRPQQDPFAYVRELVATPNRPGPLMVSLTNAMRERYRLTLAGPPAKGTGRMAVRSLPPGSTAFARKR